MGQMVHSHLKKAKWKNTLAQYEQFFFSATDFMCYSRQGIALFFSTQFSIAEHTLEDVVCYRKIMYYKYLTLGLLSQKNLFKEVQLKNKQ